MSLSVNHQCFETPYDWRDFVKYLMQENRYVLNERWQRFIQCILHTADKREYILKSGMKFARARIGIEVVESPEYYEYPLSPDKMGAPPKELASAGRLNPNGISYLYLANNKKTAISEIRPWIGADVSVGYFEILKDQRLVDLTKDKHEWPFGRTILLNEHPTPEQIEESVWALMNRTFSQPLSPHDQPLRYVPSQYLAEAFKLNGFDGIGYRSSLNKDGLNILLFDPSCARLRSCEVFCIDNIEYKFRKSGTAYSCKDDQ